MTGGSDFQWFLHHNYLVSLTAANIMKEKLFKDGAHVINIE